MAKKEGISIFTILFWGWIGWYWFGDSIKEIIHDNELKIVINEDQIDLKDETQKIIDKTREEFNHIVEDFESQKEEIELHERDDEVVDDIYEQKDIW